MTKDLITSNLLDKAADSATIEQLNTVIKARDIEIAALKAQVNALRGLLENATNSSEPDWAFEMTATIDESLEKTPQQCLAEYRNQVIDECIEEIKLAILDGKGFYVARLEELKNET